MHLPVSASTNKHAELVTIAVIPKDTASKICKASAYITLFFVGVASASMFL
jgi:hypothetical protein